MTEKAKQIKIDPMIMEVITEIICDKVLDRLANKENEDEPVFEPAGADKDVDTPLEQNKRNGYYQSGLGDFECIDAMADRFGVESVLGFCLCNAFKYLWRCFEKNDSPIEDLEKAQYYISVFINNYKGSNND